ncbi:MAG: right-handed parallel beta-helix repeat-containing protein [Sedimentisphaerales bacterium]
MRIYSICILLLLTAGCLANVLNVPSEGYPSIQQAINSAINGDTIIVAPGRYFENINFSGKAITVRSTDPNDPNIVAATILDGNRPADINSASVVTFKSGETSTSVLEGFTITGGSGSWLTTSWKFQGKRWNRCGGGVLCYNMSQPTITKNVFADNIADLGGGIYIFGDPVNPNDPSNPTVHIKPIISYNSFSNNTASFDLNFSPPDNNYPVEWHGDGGAIVCFQGVDANITNNLIENNHAYSYGGGIHLRQWSNGTIENNHIIDNNSMLGGGIHVTYTSSPAIYNNKIEYNKAGTFGGGGIYVYYYSSPYIEKNTIRYNTSSRGAGIAVMWDSLPTITTNFITDNFGGAGILCVSSSPSIQNNTIANNSAEPSSGGIHCEYGASPIIKHNVITNNGTGYGIYVLQDSNSQPMLSYNDVWGHTMGNYGPAISDQTGLNGNISADPNFVDADSNDYHLSCYSKCINAGDPNFPYQGLTDFDGEPRKIGQFIDIGADEAWPVWNISSGNKYTSIQSAIDDSNNGNTIIVAPGHYYERINFGSHNIILSSSHPDEWETAEKTIIDANQTGTAVTIAGGQDANASLQGFTITGGNATNGHAGGIWCYTAIVITRNIITNNYAFYKGGGIYLWSSSAAAHIIDNKVINNTATYAGGIFCDIYSQPLIEKNFIAYNTATDTGGGLCYSGNTGTVNLLHNTIVSNRAIWAGGVFISGLSINILNNLFLGNCATDYAGAIQVHYCRPNIINNTIVGNSATQGGGIYCDKSSSPLLANNIIAYTRRGSGLYCYNDANHPGNPYLICNDLYDNNDGNYTGALPDQTGVNGNISADPNFVDAGYWDDANTPLDTNDDFFAAGNYHILPKSPCVNVGDNNSVPAQLTTDIDLEQRIFDSTVDIGADEVITNQADFNLDGIVDYSDLTYITNYWLTEGNDLPGDLYKDGFIDFADFAVFADNWLWKASWK